MAEEDPHANAPAAAPKKRFYDRTLGYFLFSFILCIIAGWIALQLIRHPNGAYLLVIGSEAKVDRGASELVNIAIYTVVGAIASAGVRNMFQLTREGSGNTLEHRPRTYYGRPALAAIITLFTYAAIRAGIFIYEGIDVEKSRWIPWSYFITGVVVGFNPENAMKRLRDKVSG